MTLRHYMLINVTLIKKSALAFPANTIILVIIYIYLLSRNATFLFLKN